jgi:hypothetical protein
MERLRSASSTLKYLQNKTGKNTKICSKVELPIFQTAICRLQVLKIRLLEIAKKETNSTTEM